MNDYMPVLFTIDVESTIGKDPVKRLIWGETLDGERYGIERIVSILKDNNAKGLFFVDFAEAWDFGREKIKEVVEYLINEGQDVGVHIHPHHMTESKKHFLYDYCEEEQRIIIRKCTELYKEIVGRPPKSFRAGKYGANNTTLKILEELGYKYDFSEFYGQKWCGINPPICRVLPRRVNNIIEYPVTIFNSFSIPFLYKRYDKNDFTNDFHELTMVINGYLKKKNKPVFVIFAHSFSLLDFRFRDDNPIPIIGNVKKLEKVIWYISHSGKTSFICENDLEKYALFSEEDCDENIYRCPFPMNLYFSFKRLWGIRKYNRKAKVLFGCFSIIIILIVLWIIGRTLF